MMYGDVYDGWSVLYSDSVHTVLTRAGDTIKVPTCTL